MNKNTPDEIHEIIKEFDRTRTEPKQNETYILEAALFVEDVFGFMLTDDEICPEKGHNGYRDKIQDIPQVDHSLGDIFKMVVGAEILENSHQKVGKKKE